MYRAKLRADNLDNEIIKRHDMYKCRYVAYKGNLAIHRRFKTKLFSCICEDTKCVYILIAVISFMSNCN